MAPQDRQSAAIAVRDAATEAAVMALLSTAVVASINTSNRLELECKLCGERDENHTFACPVPALEEWLNPTDLLP
jgi:hypothetical protein